MIMPLLVAFPFFFSHKMSFPLVYIGKMKNTVALDRIDQELLMD
jgi:hypothetical protein